MYEHVLHKARAMLKREIKFEYAEKVVDFKARGQKDYEDSEIFFLSAVRYLVSSS